MVNKRMVVSKGVETEVAILSEAVYILQDRLYGNGQPGDIQDIKKTLDELKRAMYILVGIGVVVTFLSPLLVSALQRLFKA